MSDAPRTLKTCETCPALQKAGAEGGECHASDPRHRGHMMHGSKPPGEWPHVQLSDSCMKHPANAVLMFPTFEQLAEQAGTLAPRQARGNKKTRRAPRPPSNPTA